MTPNQPQGSGAPDPPVAPNELDVLIVGAGPVGLAAALFLARQGLHVRLIDKSEGPATESRAIGIQARTLEILEMAGAVDEFLSLGHRLQGVALFGRHGGQIGRVTFDGLPTRYNFLMTLPQSETERILADRLGEAGGLGVHVERRTTLRAFTDASGRVSATIESPDGTQTEVRPRWLIGADGAHSTVRQQLGTGFAGKTYDLTFLLADLHIESAFTEGDAQVFAHPDGLLAMFPLGGRRYRLVADNPPGVPDPLPEGARPSLQEWQALVDQRTGGSIRLTDPNWMTYFRVHSRMVDHLRRGSVFLMGDAAHIHSPALAQGMNTGIHDAWNLAWKIALVARGLAGPDLLDSYEAERMPVERRVLEMTDFTQNVVGAESRFRQVLRDLLLPVATHIPFLREKAGETVSELAVGYRGSPIVEDHPTGHGPHAGDRAPDAGMTDDAGKDVRLMSLFGTRHVLLAVDDGHDRGEGASVSEVVRRAKAQYGQVIDPFVVAEAGDRPATPDDVRRLTPKGDDFRDRYGMAGAYFLVRPDGYVALRTATSHPQRLFDVLVRHFPGQA